LRHTKSQKDLEDRGLLQRTQRSVANSPGSPCLTCLAAAGVPEGVGSQIVAAVASLADAIATARSA
jgi:hypothetical protein